MVLSHKTNESLVHRVIQFVEYPPESKIVTYGIYPEWLVSTCLLSLQERYK